MTFRPPSPASTLAFVAVVDAVIITVLTGVYFASKRLTGQAAGRTITVAVGLAAWIITTSIVVVSGALAEAPMPRLPMFFAAINIGAILFALSPIGGLLSSGLPLAALVAFQGFRFPLELVLHSWVLQGSIPDTMTWTGSNYDILSGIAAIVAAPFVSHFRAVAWIPNIIGFVLLLNVGRVAVMSSPLPFAWPVSPPLELALHMPYALIGTVCVAAALAGHVVLTRALLRHPNTVSRNS